VDLAGSTRSATNSAARTETASGSAGPAGGGAVELSQADGHVRERLGALEPLIPCLHRVGEERGMAIEIMLLDNRAGFLCRAQLADPQREPGTTGGETLQVRRVAPARFSILARQQREMRRQRRVDQGLALQEFVRDHIDPQDELEAKDRLAQRAPDGRVDHLGSLAPQARPGPARGRSSQLIERRFRGRLGKLRTDVGLETTGGMGLIEPAQDELGGREGGLELGEAPLGSHGRTNESSPDVAARCPTAASSAVRRSSNSPTFKRLVAATAVEIRTRRRGMPFSRPTPSVTTMSSRRRIPATVSRPGRS